jgi:hypothetical protein
VEHAGLRTLIMMLRHIAHARAKQILSPCVIALQVAFLGNLAIAFLRKTLDFLYR